MNQKRFPDIDIATLCTARITLQGMVAYWEWIRHVWFWKYIFSGVHFNSETATKGSLKGSRILEKMWFFSLKAEFVSSCQFSIGELPVVVQVSEITESVMGTPLVKRSYGLWRSWYRRKSNSDISFDRKNISQAGSYCRRKKSKLMIQFLLCSRSGQFFDIIL